MNDDDNYSDKRKEGGIDEQEEDSLTQTQKSTLKKKIIRLKKNLRLKLQSFLCHLLRDEAKVRMVRLIVWMNNNVYSLSNYLFVQPYSHTKQQ
jgi:hypothetical protein